MMLLSHLSRVFRGCGPKSRDKPKIYFLLYHNIADQSCFFMCWSKEISRNAFYDQNKVRRWYVCISVEIKTHCSRPYTTEITRIRIITPPPMQSNGKNECDMWNYNMRPNERNSAIEMEEKYYCDYWLGWKNWTDAITLCCC